MGTPDPKLEDAIERLTAMVGDRGETWDLSPNDREAIKLVLERCGAAIEGGAEQKFILKCRNCGHVAEEGEWVGVVGCSRCNPGQFVSVGPTAREPINMLWSGTNSQGGSTGRVYSDPLMQKAYDEGREHGAPVSEGRLREARVLPIQWRNIADAKPSSFEFATRDDAFRYCADQLERALESA